MFMADATTIARNLSNLPILGACSVFTIGQERTSNNLRREFGPNPAVNLGKPAETYPGLPEYSVTLHRVDLYDTNLMEAFGYDSLNIVAQTKPLVIVAEQAAPTNADGSFISLPGIGGGVARTLAPRTYIVTGCWLNGFPTEFDITADDQKSMVEVEMIAADVWVSPVTPAI
jgi:hypothetical protein